MLAPEGTLTINPPLAKAQRLIENDRYDQAAQILIGYLRGHPNDPRALAKLGFVAMRLGALGQAEQFLRKAIAGGATDFETRRNLATVTSQQDRPQLAIPMFESLAKESSDPAIRAILASLLEKVGRSEDARELYHHLVEENPDNPMLRIGLGHCLRSAGLVEDAIKAYRGAIAINDEFGDAWWGLASIKRKIFGPADISAIRASLAIAIDLRNQAPLHFALARALHDVSEFEEAFYHYSAGNRLRAESLNYNADGLSEEIDEIEHSIGPSFFDRNAKVHQDAPTPVFVVSLPRSGSTLLEQILGSHPSIEPIGELPYIPAILRSHMEFETRHGKTTVPEAVLRLDDGQAAALGEEYLRRVQLHRRTDRSIFIDKLPHNWSNILFTRRILPHARFLDIRRPAMDCCFSNFTQSFTSAHPSSFTLKDIGRSYIDNVRLMKHLDKVAPGMVHHVNYKSLVEDARKEIGSVLEYLDLPWNDAVLSFDRLDRVVRTPSSEQVRRPLNRDGMNIWHPYLQWLGPLRDVLGDLAED